MANSSTYSGIPPKLPELVMDLVRFWIGACCTSMCDSGFALRVLGSGVCLLCLFNTFYWYRTIVSCNYQVLEWGFCGGVLHMSAALTGSRPTTVAGMWLLLQFLLVPHTHDEPLDSSFSLSYTTLVPVQNNGQTFRSCAILCLRTYVHFLLFTQGEEIGLRSDQASC